MNGEQAAELEPLLAQLAEKMAIPDPRGRETATKTVRRKLGIFAA